MLQWACLSFGFNKWVCMFYCARLFLGPDKWACEPYFSNSISYQPPNLAMVRVSEKFESNSSLEEGNNA